MPQCSNQRNVCIRFLFRPKDWKTWLFKLINQCRTSVLYDQTEWPHSSGNLNESSVNLNDGSIYRKMVLWCLASRGKEQVKTWTHFKADKTTNYYKTEAKDYLRNVTEKLQNRDKSEYGTNRNNLCRHRNNTKTRTCFSGKICYNCHQKPMQPKET